MLYFEVFSQSVMILSSTKGNIIYQCNPSGMFLRRKTNPSQLSIFPRVCVFVVYVFFGGSEQSVLLWSCFSNRRHSVCTGSSCPWPKPTDQQQRRTRLTVASACSWRLCNGAIPQARVISLHIYPSINLRQIAVKVAFLPRTSKNKFDQSTTLFLGIIRIQSFHKEEHSNSWGIFYFN